MHRILATAAAAIALAAAPTIASARQAPAGAAEVQPADEQVEGSEIRGGFILPLLGLVAIILTVYLLTRDNSDAEPISP